MQQSTKTTLLIVGAVASVLLIVLGAGLLVSAPVVPMATPEGFQGIGGFVGGMRLVGYMLLICGAALTLLFVTVLLRMVFRVFGDVATAIEWLVTKVRNAWVPPPPALETVLRVQNGKPITLGDALQSATSKLKAANEKIDSLESELAAVVARTAHIEPPPPPPPPKTIEETAAEQAAVIADLQRKLAAMQAQQAAKPASPTPQPVPTEAAT